MRIVGSILAVIVIVPASFLIFEVDVEPLNLLIGSGIILIGGFSPQKCKVCDGKGSIVL